MHRSARWFAALLLIVLTGCATPAPPPSRTDTAPGAPPAEAPRAQRKSIDLILPAEVNAFITALGLVGNAARPSRYVHEFVNAYMTVRDPEDEVAPHLAEALPSLDNGTWKVFDDGRMEVAWKIRPGVTWHDGTPLASEDIKFSWEVAKDPQTLFGVSTVARYIDRIETPDPNSFVVYWKETQQFGGEMGERQFDILPRHVLEPVYRADPASIPNHPHFSTPEAFVGSGPYRPVEWEKGSHITVEAWDKYVFGRPKIDRISFRFMPDSRTALANLLSGAADAAYLGVQFTEGRVLEQEWNASGRGTVQFLPGSARHLIPQFRSELASPGDLLNLPVRKALAYGTNRQDLVDALDLPPEMIANSTAFPGTAIGDAVERVVVRYPYDPNRAAALLAEAGWQPGSDGILTRGGRPFDLEYRADPLPFEGVVFPILQQQYRRLGINLALNTVLVQNLQDHVEYPGLLSTAITVNNMIFAQRWHTRFTAGPQTRYSGENRQGYANPAADAALDRLFTAVRRDDQHRYWGEVWRTLTEDVALIPTYYQLDTYIARKGLSGLQQKNRLGSPAYQVHLWDVQ